MLTMRSGRFSVLVRFAAAVEIDQGEFFQELSLLMNGDRVVGHSDIATLV